MPYLRGGIKGRIKQELLCLTLYTFFGVRGFEKRGARGIRIIKTAKDLDHENYVKRKRTRQFGGIGSDSPECRSGRCFGAVCGNNGLREFRL